MRELEALLKNVRTLCFECTTWGYGFELWFSLFRLRNLREFLRSSRNGLKTFKQWLTAWKRITRPATKVRQGNEWRLKRFFIGCLISVFSTEKNTLMLRNAQLSQDLETERHKTRQRSEEHLSEIRKKECAIQGLEQSLQDHQKEISEHLKKVLHPLDLNLLIMTSPLWLLNCSGAGFGGWELELP